MSIPSTDGRPPFAVRASEYLLPTETLVDSATRLAEVVVTALRSHAVVTVSLIGVRGLSSSFANVLFQAVLREAGPEAIEGRVLFETDSKAQQEVLARSREAVLAAG